jgi:hypothetical protein
VGHNDFPQIHVMVTCARMCNKVSSRSTTVLAQVVVHLFSRDCEISNTIVGFVISRLQNLERSYCFHKFKRHD